MLPQFLCKLFRQTAGLWLGLLLLSAIFLLLGHPSATRAAGPGPVIDTFETIQDTETLTDPGTVSSQVSGAGIISDEREIELTMTSNFFIIAAGVNGGAFQYDHAFSTNGSAKIIWNGTTGTPLQVDLTAGGQDSFILSGVVNANDTDTTIEVSDPISTSTCAFTLPRATTAANAIFPFSHCTGGADFTNVTAITLTVGSPTSLEIQEFGTTTLLRVTKDDDPTDENDNGKVDPGETIQYTVQIENADDLLNIAAEDVEFYDTIDINTTMASVFNASCSGADCTPPPPTVPNLGDIKDATSIIIKFTVQIRNPLLVNTTIISNQGTISGTNIAPAVTDDPATGAYDDPTRTDMSAPVIVATKRDYFPDPDGDGLASPGEYITYTVWLTNTGNQTATGVSFNDPINNTTPGSGSRAIPNIPPGGVYSFTFVVQINSPDNLNPPDTTRIENQGDLLGNFVTTPTDDPDTPWAPEDPTFTPLAVPIISMTKVDELANDADGNSVVSPGDTLNYTLVITNVGTYTATTVEIDDPLDPNTTLTGAINTTCCGSFGAFPFTLSSDIGPGEAVTVTFAALIDNPFGGLDAVYNQAEISGDNFADRLSDDPDTITATDPTSTTVYASPIITAYKTSQLLVDFLGDGDIDPGDLLEYTIVITNNGNQDAVGVVFSDTVDSNTTLITDSINTTCCGSFTTFPITLSTIAGNGGVVTVTFAVTINNPLPPGVTTIANQGVISGNNFTDVDTDDPDTTSDDDPTSDPINGPMMSVSKSDALLTDADGSGTVSPGDTVRYTVTINNTGTEDATGVTLADTIDPNTTSATTFPINVGTVAQGGSTSVQFDVTINTPFPVGVTTISNQGTLSGDNFVDLDTDDPATPTLNDPTLTPIDARPVIAAIKRYTYTDNDGNTQISPNDTIHYTVLITNTGNQTATSVTFTDPIDPNSTLVANSIDTSCCGVNLSSFPALGNIAPGGANAVTITFDVTVNNPFPVGVTQLSNQGTVSATNLTAPKVTDNPTTVTLNDPTIVSPIVAAPAFAVTKADSLIAEVFPVDGNFDPGDRIRYTIIITNTGNQTATNVQLADVLNPSWFSLFGSINTSCCGTDPNFPVSLGNIGTGPANAVTVTFDANIIVAATSGITRVNNQGTLTANNLPTPKLTDDPDDPTVDDPTETLLSYPRLAATKAATLVADSDGDGLFSPGELIRYTILITNSGTEAATGVTLDDIIDANTALTSSITTSCCGSFATFPISLGDIAPGSVTVSFDVAINNPFPNGVTQVSNQGTLEGTNFLDLVTNDPATTTPNDPTITTIGAAPRIEATKTGELFMDTDDDGAASPGDTLRYTIKITNTGTQNALGVVFSDTVDPDTTLGGVVASTQGTVVSGNNLGDTVVIVNLGTVAPGAANVVTIIFNVTINNPISADAITITNQGSISGSNISTEVPTDSPGTDVPGDSTDTPLSDDTKPDVTATKTGGLWGDQNGDGLAAPGDTIRYTVLITNSGNQDAGAVTFHDTPDPNTTLIPDTLAVSTGTIVTGNNPGDTEITVVIDPLVGDGGVVSITFEVSINDPLPAGVITVSNQVVITGSNFTDVVTDDPVTSDPDDPTTIPILNPGGSADLQITKASQPASVLPGQSLSYILTFVNRGPLTATGVVISDATIADILQNPQFENSGANIILIGTNSWQVQNLVANQGGTITITGQVKTLAVGTQFVNTATITGTVRDDTPLNNTAQATVTIESQPPPTWLVYLPLIMKGEGTTPPPTPTPQGPDLVGTFRLEPQQSTFAAGEPVKIIATVTNQGDAAAGPFWVDFYINPTTAPTQANTRWNDVCTTDPNDPTLCISFGLAWYVTGLEPGESITLTSDVGVYDPDRSLWPGYFWSGTSDLYLYVDTWNPGIEDGAVSETDEANNRAEQHGLSVAGANPAELHTLSTSGIPPR